MADELTALVDRINALGISQQAKQSLFQSQAGGLLERQRTQPGREAAAVAQVQANPTVSGAVGADPRSLQSRGLLSGLASPDAPTRQAANTAFSGLQGQRTAQIAQQALDTAEVRQNEAITARLNQRYLTQIKTPVEVADAMQQIRAALDTKDSLGVLAATIKLAKTLDPDSRSVTEGEQRAVRGGLGIGESLMVQYNQLFGEGFSEEGAERFWKVALSVGTPLLERGKRIDAEFSNLANLSGVDARRVTTGAGFLVPEFSEQNATIDLRTK